MTTRPLAAVAVGGALGALARWGLGQLTPDGSGFPWTTFAVNVSGAFLLALLPALPRVRRSAVLTAGLGPGLCGGYTTLSTYSEQTRALLADGRGGLAAAYVAGTLLACLLAVSLATALSSGGDRTAFEAAGGDE